MAAAMRCSESPGAVLNGRLRDRLPLVHALWDHDPLARTGPVVDALPPRVLSPDEWAATRLRLAVWPTTVL